MSKSVTPGAVRNYGYVPQEMHSTMDLFQDAFDKLDGDIELDSVLRSILYGQISKLKQKYHPATARYANQGSVVEDAVAFDINLKLARAILNREVTVDKRRGEKKEMNESSEYVRITIGESDFERLESWMAEELDLGGDASTLVTTVREWLNGEW